MKVWARFACALIHPPTPRVPAGAKPFAKADLVPTTGALMSAGKAGAKA